MIDVVNPNFDNWMFDQVWPKLQPAFAELIDEVTAELPSLDVDAGGIKGMGLRWGAHVHFSDAPIPQVTRHDIAIVIDCGTYFSLSADRELSAMWNRMVCRSEITRGLRGSTQIVRYGPSIQFELSGATQTRSEIDRWADAAVTFIEGNAGLVISELKSE